MVESFFDAYRDSFPGGPSKIAAFYAEPSVTARGGVVRASRSRAETTALMTEVDAQYRARGFARADYVLLDHQALGTNGVFATLQWTYRNASGAEIWQTKFSYNLYRRDGDWKILMQTMHDQ